MDRLISERAVIESIEYFQMNPQRFDFVDLIDDIKEIPSVEVISLSVIDDIKAEIENLPTGVELTDGSVREFTFKNYKKGLLKIINEKVKEYKE